uniref:Uncharacterized protein n=1 Tax=Cucumis melo TaxID=3656 RepID=A0A9I9E5J2_CUCME
MLDRPVVKAALEKILFPMLRTMRRSGIGKRIFPTRQTRVGNKAKSNLKYTLFLTSCTVHRERRKGRREKRRFVAVRSSSSSVPSSLSSLAVLPPSATLACLELRGFSFFLFCSNEQVANPSMDSINTLAAFPQGMGVDIILTLPSLPTQAFGSITSNTPRDCSFNMFISGIVTASLLRRRVPHLVVYLIGRVRVMALVMKLFSVSSSVASAGFSTHKRRREKNIERVILNATSCIGIRSIGKGTPDSTFADACHGIGRGIPEAVLVWHRECLSRLISPDTIPDIVKNVGISFPDFFHFLRYFCESVVPPSLVVIEK